MEIADILSHIDHTILDQTATWPQVKEVLEQAIHFKAASACIPPGFVAKAKSHVGGALPICTVIAFPFGYSTTAAKVCETADALKNGADEVDMVINLGWMKTGRFEKVQEEIEAVRAASVGCVLKVIVETAQLTEREKIEACRIVTASGADYIKTSTGFGGGGATVPDVMLMAANIGPDVRIKASGGIGTLDDAQRFLLVGADRIGSSRIIRTLAEIERAQ